MDAHMDATEECSLLDSLKGYIRAEEIGKRLDYWAMARGKYVVIDED